MILLKIKRVVLIVILFFISFNSGAQKKALESSGDVILFTLPVATLTTTFIVGDGDGSWQYIKGLLLNGAITYGLKLTVNKSRPDGSNENSFPSGHTSTTFQSASFVHFRYGFKYSIPAYALAGFTAFTRLESNKHDGWDVIAGAIIGVGSSYLFTTPYLQEHMELTYSGSNGDHLIGFTFTF